MAVGDGDVFLGRFLSGTGDHLVGNGAGEDHHQVGRADLPLEVGGHSGEYLGPVSEIFSEGAVLSLHPFVSADNDDAHMVSFRLAEANLAMFGLVSYY